MIITKSTPKKKMLELGKECDGCGHCCSYGAGFLADEDIKLIASHLRISENKLKEKYLDEVEKFDNKHFRPKLIKEDKPYGKCIFLKKNKCSIHKVKPLQCKIANCKEHGQDADVWFTLNYFVDEKNPESVRQWNVYLNSGGHTIPGGELKDLEPNKARLKKILNYDIFR